VLPRVIIKINGAMTGPYQLIQGEDVARASWHISVLAPTRARHRQTVLAVLECFLT
jgi:hypothetical protein